MLCPDDFDPLDRRPEQRARVGRKLDRLVDELLRDATRRLVFDALVAAARELTEAADSRNGGRAT